MENSYYNHANRAYFLCKSYLFVKFFVIFLFIANVTLANGNGTSELYDIKKGTLLEYFKDIEKETGYVFIYSKDIRPSLNQVVSVDLSRKKTITEKLSALFEKTNLVYEINGKQIVVKRKTAVKKNLSSQPQEPRRITGTITDTKGEPIIGANIKEVDLLTALKQPLFMAYRANQPFNCNHLKPCPMLENPEILQRMVHETGAHSTDLQSPESVEHLCGKCAEYAKNWDERAQELWNK